MMLFSGMLIRGTANNDGAILMSFSEIEKQRFLFI